MTRTGMLAAIIAPMLATAGPAVAQGARNTPPQHTEIHLAVFGNDPCPKGEGDEIVVCARFPESERYRIPKKLRDEKAAEARRDQSWVARSRDIDQAGSDNRPDSLLGGRQRRPDRLLGEVHARRPRAERGGRGGDHGAVRIARRPTGCFGWIAGVQCGRNRLPSLASA